MMQCQNDNILEMLGWIKYIVVFKLVTSVSFHLSRWLPENKNSFLGLEM
jgi:hypothetical protein